MNWFWLLLLLPSIAFADITFVNQTEGHEGNISDDVIVAAEQNHTAGNLLVVLVGGASVTETVDSITDTAGNTFIQCSGAYNNDQASVGFVDIWYAKNIAGNANNVVTVNLTGAMTYRSVAVHQYAGADTVDPFEIAKTGSEVVAAIVTSDSFSPENAGNVSVSYTNASDTVVDWTPDANYNSRVTSTDPSRFSQDRLNSPAGAQTASASLDNVFALEITVASFREPVIPVSFQETPKVRLRNAVIRNGKF